MPKQIAQVKGAVEATARQHDRIPGLKRQLLAGFLAGASGVVALLVGFAFILAVGGLWVLLRDIASGLRGELPFWQTLGQALAQNLGQLPWFIWSARWGIASLGGWGVLLALVESLAPRIERPWRGWLSRVAALGIAGTIAFALQYANRENLIAWMAEQPGVFGAREQILVSDTMALLIGLLGALISAYVIWSLWHWWYMQWARWLRLPEQRATAPEAPQPAPPVDDWRVYQARLHRLKRGLEAPAPASAPVVASPPQNSRGLAIALAGLAGATLALFGAVQLYHVFGSQIAGGSLFVSAQAPHDTAALEFARAPQQLILASINGEGHVDVALTGPYGATPARVVEGFELVSIAQGYRTARVDLRGLELGSYQLETTLRTGRGGQLRYIALQGGGTGAQIAAWLVGLAAGGWLVLAALASLEVLTRRGWLKATAV